MRSSVCILLIAFLGQCIVTTWQVQVRCPVIRLQNGRVRARGKGRIVRFSCYEDFILVGNRYSTCVRGQWDTPTPVCVNAECPMPPNPAHALMAPKYNGAILAYFCEPGYALIGPAEIYCDGKQWNGTTPHCRDTTAEAPTQCDFEKPDLCWWEQDPQHDFDWQRHNFDTPSSHIGTGPTHDHTLGPGNDGYYLYIEASGRLVNDTARIVSPIYTANLTESGCFSFWYHMYGATVGALNVYFKQETDSAPRLMFSKTGDQGNHWIQGIFNLPKAETGFQIIIEGVRGSSYVSDIAIDDVAILQGDNCTANKTGTAEESEGDEDQVEIVNAQQSCRGRCKNTVGSHFTTANPPSPSELCLCTLDCAEESICCPDYAEYCILASTENTSGDVTEVTIANHDVTTTTTTTTTSKSPAVKHQSTITDIATIKTNIFNGNGISINPKDDIDPITARPVVSTTKRPVANATRPKTERPFKVTSPTTLPVVPTKEIHTKETPFVPVTTVTKRYVRLHEQPGSDSRVQDQEQLHRSTARFGLPGIVGMTFGLLTGLSITMMLVFFILKKGKTYKRGSNGSALSEDSDVRFLTSDEILDFTLARPSENDE